MNNPFFASFIKLQFREILTIVKIGMIMKFKSAIGPWMYFE